MRAPLAALVLLFYHAVLSSFFSVPKALQYHIDSADRILSTTLHEFPNGALFLYLRGRLERLKKDLEGSNASFVLASTVQTEWKQLRHLCLYEMGWNCMLTQQWAEANQHWTALTSESNWSKAFYSFVAAACMVMTGQLEEAATMFMKATSLVKRKYGGRTISAEQYVLRKVAEYNMTSPDALRRLGARISALELIYLWNLTSCLPRNELERFLYLLDAAIEECTAYDFYCVFAYEPEILLTITCAVLLS